MSHAPTTSFLYGGIALAVGGAYYFVNALLASRAGGLVHVSSLVGRSLGNARGEVAPRVAMMLGVICLLVAAALIAFAYVN